jgi:DNA oxidative demethylase
MKISKKLEGFMLEVVCKLDIDTQMQLLEECMRVITIAPLFQKTMPRWGHNFKYLCTSAGDYGWLSDRKGYRYETQHPITQDHFPPIPDIIHDLSIEVVESLGHTINPQSALINWYREDGTLGLHQDKTEQSLAPVVSFSLGDDCIFTLGGLSNKDDTRDITLHSGDIFVMGADDRLTYHGVKKIIPNTAPPELKMEQSGRVNITVRQVYD